MSAIHIHNLSKRYPNKPTPALNNLDLTVERGEIFGYLGSNGAGKTTTIRIMLDLIRPTSGSVHMLGMDAQQDATKIKHHVGNLPGELTLWPHLTGQHTLHYLANLRPGCDLTYAFQLAERLHLDLSVKTGNYSTGNKRKLGIIQAMMHRPQLLILDEPTTGLDPIMRQEFNQLLLETRARGNTVFLSSHVLSEVQMVCDRVGILRRGELQTVQKMTELQRSVERLVTLYSQESFRTQEWLQLDGVAHVKAGIGYLQLRVSGSLDAVIKHAANYVIDDMRVETADLTDLFRNFYEQGND